MTLTKMLIDARHRKKTRVAVIKGNRIEEFDFESADRRQLKGNIYLAKVTRVEPSLQAAFVDYGGNRQGFLAFSEFTPIIIKFPAKTAKRFFVRKKNILHAITSSRKVKMMKRAKISLIPKPSATMPMMTASKI